MQPDITALSFTAANRQLNTEASKWFYGSNLFIRVRSNTHELDNERVMLDLMIGIKAQNLRSDLMAMSVDFTWPEEPSAPIQEFTMARRDLRLFLLVLWKGNLKNANFLSGCHIHMRILNTFGLSDQHLQQRLQDLESVSIGGTTDPKYAQQLAVSMMASKLDNGELPMLYPHARRNGLRPRHAKRTAPRLSPRAYRDIAAGASWRDCLRSLGPHIARFRHNRHPSQLASTTAALYRICPHLARRAARDRRPPTTLPPRPRRLRCRRMKITPWAGAHCASTCAPARFCHRARSCGGWSRCVSSKPGAIFPEASVTRRGSR